MLVLVSIFLVISVVNTQNCSYTDPLQNTYFPRVYHIPVSKDKVEGADNCRQRSKSFTVKSCEVPQGEKFYAYLGTWGQTAQDDSGEGSGESGCSLGSINISIYLGDGFIPTTERYTIFKDGITSGSWGSLTHHSRNGSRMFLTVVDFSENNGDCFTTLWVSGFWFSPSVIATTILIPLFLCCCCCCCSLFLLSCITTMIYCPSCVAIFGVGVIMLVVGGLLGGVFGMFGAGGLFGCIIFCCCCCGLCKKDEKGGKSDLDKPLLGRESIQDGEIRNSNMNNNDNENNVDHIPMIFGRSGHPMGNQLQNDENKDFNMAGSFEEAEYEENNNSVMNQPFLDDLSNNQQEEGEAEPQSDPPPSGRPGSGRLGVMEGSKPKPSRVPPKPPGMISQPSAFNTISTDSSLLLNIPPPGYSTTSYMMLDDGERRESLVDNVTQEIDAGFKDDVVEEEEEQEEQEEDLEIVDPTKPKPYDRESMVIEEVVQEFLEGEEPVFLNDVVGDLDDYDDDEEEEEIYGEEDVQDGEEQNKPLIKKEILFERQHDIDDGNL